jgi:hypothetical protein
MREVKKMETVGGIQNEIVAYIQERIQNGTSREVVTREITERWPNVVSDKGIADSYLEFAEKKV